MAEVKQESNQGTEGQENTEAAVEATNQGDPTAVDETGEEKKTKTNKVTNPLTMISIFAGFAEVAGTVILIQLEQPFQEIFIWFVMGFPVLLVLLFFATMNFNSVVMYAPSDFKDEDNYYKLAQASMDYENEIKELEEELNKRNEIIEIIKAQLESHTNQAEAPTDFNIRFNSDMDINNMDINNILLKDKLAHIKSTDELIRSVKKKAIEMSQWNAKTKAEMKAKL